MTMPLEIVFGVRTGNHIRFVVLGYTCPDSDTDWYRSQLDAEIHIHIGKFRGFRSLVMFSDDFHHFRAALKELLSGAAASAMLESGDFLAVDVSIKGSSYKVCMQLDALQRDGEFVECDGGDKNWEWHLTLDHSSLDTLLKAVSRVSDFYSTWSVPQSK